MGHERRRVGGVFTVLGLAACLSCAVLRAEPPLIGLPFDAYRAHSLQADWARAFGLDREVTNSIGMKLVLIPGGRFDMGPNGSKYRVTLAKPFYLGVTEVTLGQYRRFKPGHQVEGADPEFNEDDRPAAMVSWDDARAFSAWLSQWPEEKRAGRVYALPTEAQWEWAARAGTATSGYFGNTDKGQVQRHLHPEPAAREQRPRPAAGSPAEACGRITSASA